MFRSGEFDICGRMSCGQVFFQDFFIRFLKLISYGIAFLYLLREQVREILQILLVLVKTSKILGEILQEYLIHSANSPKLPNNSHALGNFTRDSSISSFDNSCRGKLVIHIPQEYSYVFISITSVITFEKTSGLSPAKPSGKY